MKFNRIIVIVTDSVAPAELPMPKRFGDKGADTYGHIDANVPLSLPNLRRMGLGKVANIHPEDTDVVGSYGSWKKSPWVRIRPAATGNLWETPSKIPSRPLKSLPTGSPRRLYGKDGIWLHRQ